MHTQNNNNLSATLNHGVQFQKYQNKISNRVSKTLTEGFSNSSSSSSGSSTTPTQPSSTDSSSSTSSSTSSSSTSSQQDTNDMMELQKLQTIYKVLQKEYDLVQLLIDKNANKYSIRESIKNPYANTNLMFGGSSSTGGGPSTGSNDESSQTGAPSSSGQTTSTPSSGDNNSGRNNSGSNNGATGQLGYVTKDGVYKWYSSWDVINNTAGKNGCPVLRENQAADYTLIDQTTDNYNVPGTVISVKPPLVIGGSMISGQSCGNEGSNVYVNSAGKSTTASYIGCYKNSGSGSGGGGGGGGGGSSKSAMTLEPGGTVFNYDTCKQRAQDSGASYFGLQNYNNGVADCYTSNDYNGTIQYGSGNTFDETVAWTLDGKTSNSTMMLKNDGNLYIYDSAGNQLSNSSTGTTDCAAISPSNIVATWGGNVAGVTGGNASAYVNKYNTGGLASFNYTVGKDQSDPASGKEKTFDISYNCGSKIKSQHIDAEAANQNVTVDCSDQAYPCTCYLILQDGGIVSINKGDSPNNNAGNLYKWPAVDVNNSVSNPDFQVASGKTAANWIGGNSGLNSGEWIASNDGLLVLIMQTDGKLCIKTYQQTIGCPIQTDGNAYGNAAMNAVYGFDLLTNNSNVGKMGYVDETGKLQEYPSSMVGLSNTYFTFPNYDYSGGDVANMPIQNSTNDDCKTASNNNADSGGYAFDNSTKNCWVKTKDLTITSQKIPSTTTNLFIKRPSVNNSDGCGKKYEMIDSSMWENYPKGDAMTPDTKCGLAKATSKQQEKLEELRTQLNQVGSKMVDKINKLQSDGASLNSDMSSTKAQLDKNLGEYNNVNKMLANATNSSITTLNGMLNDSDLVILQENYSYLFWSIFAVGLVIVTMNGMKK